MENKKRFRTEYRILGGRKVEVKVPVERISHEEFERRMTEIMKRVIERE